MEKASPDGAKVSEVGRVCNEEHTYLSRGCVNFVWILNPMDSSLLTDTQGKDLAKSKSKRKDEAPIPNGDALGKDSEAIHMIDPQQIS